MPPIRPPRRGGLGDVGRNRSKENIADSRNGKYGSPAWEKQIDGTYKAPTYGSGSSTYDDDLSSKSLEELAREAKFDWNGAFGPIKVAETTTEYQAMGASTRLTGVQFVSTISDYDLRMLLIDVVLGVSSVQLLETRITGNMYVRWRKGGPGKRLSAYGPIPLSEYRRRIGSVGSSWGQAVLTWGQHRYEDKAGLDI